MNHSQRYKSTGSSPCRTGCDPSLEPKSSHLSSPERFPISSPSASLSIIAARSVVGPAMSPSCRDPLRFIHHSPRVAKSTPLHHRHTETHRCIKSHEDDSPSPAFNHDNLVNAAKEPTQQPHEHQRTYQRPSLSTGSTRLRSRSPPSPRTNSNAAIGTRRSTTINSGGPRNHSTGNDGRGERLPSLFAQLKAKLEAPRRPIIPAISTSPLSLPIRPIGHYDHHHHPSAQADEDYYPSTHPRSPPLYRHHPMEDPVGESVPIDRNRHYPVSDDGPWPPLANRQSQPSLFGIQCSAAGQRAYSNHNDDTERSFLRLQHEDNGRVEHRTIAFATHLSISRWEPVVPSTTPSSFSESPRPGDAAAAATPSSIDELRANSDRSGYNNKNKINGGGNDHINNCNSSSSYRGHMSPTSASWSPRPPLTKQPQHQHRNSPLYTARLMSLANYIRHIVSLSSGNTSSTLAQRQQEQQRQLKLQGCRPMSSYPSEAGYNADAVNGYGNSPRRVYQDSTSLPSPLSAGSGPGPIKAMMSLSSRKHRHSSEYHDHQTRRQMYHHSQQQQQHQLHRLPSPTSPTVNPQQQQRSQGMGAASSPTSNSPTRSVSPYLRIPYPNLTMTLALIYVDRLKAKYPEAKGEPGCSHRLFLVAYIIAAKYRCCVELAALLQEHEDHVIELENRRSRNDHGYNKHEHRGQGGESYYHSSYHSKHDLLDSTHKELVDRVFEARARAELILSNHEWVRLLCLGSFTRPSPSRFSTSAHAPGTMAARTAPSQPMTQPGSPSSSLVSPKPEPLPIHSPLPCDTVRGNSAHNVYHSALAAPGQVKPTLSSPALPSSPPPSTPQTPTAVFQVEDLDRMETEFLTFLDFDLSTRGQDLNTCWGLLVGSKS